MTVAVQPVPGAALDDQAIDAYLVDLAAWRSASGAALLELDEQVKVAGLPDASTDVGLAFSIWRAAGARVDEVVAARGTGRMSGDERAAVQGWVWAPISDGSGTPVASNLPEARTLVDALITRLRASVDDRGQRIAAVTSVLAPLTERMQHAAGTAAALGEMVRQVEALAARLNALGPDTPQERVAAETAAIDQALQPIERDLLQLGRAKATLTDDVVALPARLAGAERLEAEVRDVATRCLAKIADPPNLAVPDVSALGAPPTLAEITALEWRAGRAAVDAYVTKLSRVERALGVARDTYAGPLQRRDDLRGLLDGYRAMAAGRGLGEAPAASAAYDAARAALYTAPCDLAAAEALVEAYQRVVRGAGPAPTPEDRR